MNTTDVDTSAFSIICRTCLRDNNKLRPLSDSKAVEMLNYCNFSEVTENDGLPHQICLNCLEILEQCYNFKQLCKKSESILTKSLVKRSSADLICGVLDERLFTLKNVSEECGIQECSLDSNDFRKNDALVSLENAQAFSESETQEKDLISFLEDPLPPPLQYQCKNCSHSFSELNDLKVHQSIHNHDLTCSVCSKKFTRRQSLKRHLKIHLIEKPHICHLCSKSFPESYALVKHLRHHSGIPREKRHFCEECDPGFSEPYYLKVHMRKHTGERPLVCPNCDKAFADPRSLKTHILIHNEEKPYKCIFCNKCFNQSANLTKHLRVHTGEKPYVCKLCDKRFSQSSSLEKHKKIHLRGKIYSCQKCNERFFEKSGFKRHLKVHEDQVADFFE